MAGRGRATGCRSTRGWAARAAALLLSGELRAMQRAQRLHSLFLVFSLIFYITSSCFIASPNRRLSGRLLTEGRVQRYRLRATAARKGALTSMRPNAVPTRVAL